MPIKFGQNLISSLFATKGVEPADEAKQKFMAIQKTQVEGLGNPNKPESRVAGLRGDNLYYFA